MRVCHVSPHLPPDQAANALLPAELGRWMSARGDVVRYVAHKAAQTAAPATGGALRAQSESVQFIPRRQRTGLAHLLRIDALVTMRRVRAALDELAGDADLLHLHSNGLIVEVAAAWAKRHKKPYVLTLYGTEIWHYKPRGMINPFTRAYQGAAEVTFYSQGLLDHARKAGLDRPGLSVVYPAVAETFVAADTPTREALREQLGIREPRVVLNVKRLHELAGQKYLIDAFARIAQHRRDVRLVICGTGALRDALENQARTERVGHATTFAGLVPNDVVAQYAAIADVFALPSLLEALPTVAVEALACGTPVVSADHPGGVELHRILGDDVTVVPREDSAALAAALDGHLRAPRRTRPETTSLLAKHFSPAAVLTAFDGVYTRAIASGLRARG